jgi:hypothetical protein
MGLFDRLFRRSRRRRRTGGDRRQDPRNSAYLADWAARRHGVEAFVEPATYVTETTVVLVAHDGEWTRRRITEAGARELGKRLEVPIYDVRKVGYPQRMRDYTARMAREP